jgi:Fur family ferric uptake transcriptional regulator
MSSPRDAFRALLKTNGYSITKARLNVFDALLGKEPLDMHALVEKTGQVDRASVYRAVELFERLGIVQRLHTGWKYKLELTDKFAEHHHHLTCVRCGKTTPMNEHELETLIAKMAAAHQFTPTAHQIEIQGVCAECARLADK